MFWIYALSSLKIVWTVWLIILCLNFSVGDREAVIVLIILIVFSDIIDGRIASWFKSNNARRRLFDNFTDVIVTHAAYIAILYALNWPGWWYIPLFIRDGLLVLMGVKASKYKIVVFPAIIHKLSRLALPISAVFMVSNYYGEIALIVALSLFFFALVDYYGYFIIMLHKAGRGDLSTNDKGMDLNEAHLNSSLTGIRSFASAPKLLPPFKQSK